MKNYYKYQLCHKQVMVLEVLQESIRALFPRVPAAHLLHADIEWSENKYDSVNWSGNASARFAVSVSPVIKIELTCTPNFVKIEGQFRTNGWRRNGSFRIRHEESGEEVNMTFFDDGVHMWDQKNGEHFRELIGNPPLTRS